MTSLTSVKTIMMPIGVKQPSSDCFRPFLTFANEQECRLLLVSVIDELDTVFGYFPNKSSYDLLGAIEKSTLDHLQMVNDNLSNLYPNIDFELHLLIGKPFIKLIELSRECSVDLIVLDGLHGGVNTRTKFSSLSKHLMRKSAAPVCAVSTHSQNYVRNIVAAIDISVDTDEGKALNQSILLTARNIAKNLNARLCVLHAWRLCGESYLSTWGGKNKLEIAVLAKDEKTRREKLIKSLIYELGIEEDTTIYLEEGRPDTVLPNFVNTQRTDLLVMNTAESMLDTVNCSVMTIKSSDFSSPLLQEQ